MIYSTLTTPLEKEEIKPQVFELFEKVFERPLSEPLWENIFITSPYEDSLLLVAIEDDKLVGTANLIPQKYNLGAETYDYYLFTTSMIDPVARSQGVYFELIRMIKEAMRSNGKQFVFVFPNKLVAPIITSGLVGFKKFKEFKLMKIATESFNSSEHVGTFVTENAIDISTSFLDWRLGRAAYFWCEMDGDGTDVTFLCKEFNGCLDIVEVFSRDQKRAFDKDFSLPVRSIKEFEDVVISSLRYSCDAKILDQISTVVFSDSEDIYQLELDISLLAWDVV